MNSQAKAESYGSGASSACTSMPLEAFCGWPDESWEFVMGVEIVSATWEISPVWPAVIIWAVLMSGG